MTKREMIASLISAARERWEELDESVDLFQDHFNIPGTNVSILLLNPSGSVSALRGFAEVTSAQDDERQFRFGTTDQLLRNTRGLWREDGMTLRLVSRG